MSGVTLLSLLGASFYPYPPVTPGSDYDLAFHNFCLLAFGYGVGGGIAGLLAVLAVAICPNTPRSAKTVCPREASVKNSGT